MDQKKKIMYLRDYIEWTKQINEYKDSPALADPEAWGFKSLGKIQTPKLQNLGQPTAGSEGYSSLRHDSLTKWARSTWPFLKCLDAKIQIQSPNEECKPHLDFLGYYLEQVCDSLPGLKNIPHSLHQPGIDVWRLFVAIDDQIDGQRFVINNNDWAWKAGDCIRLNNWQALHWTQNNSRVARSIIKITGIKT